jgi:hypothetical protein
VDQLANYSINNSIFNFSFLGRPGLVMRNSEPAVAYSVVAGLAYEAIKILSRHQENAWLIF